MHLSSDGKGKISSHNGNLPLLRVLPCSGAPSKHKMESMLVLWTFCSIFICLEFFCLVGSLLIFLNFVFLYFLCVVCLIFSFCLLVCLEKEKKNIKLDG